MAVLRTRSTKLSWLGRAAVVALFMSQIHLVAGQRMCGLWNHRSAIVRDRLFFMSGNYSYDNGEEARSQPSIYSLNLDSTFDASGPMVDDALDAEDLPTSDLGATAPAFDQPALFYDRENMYAYVASPLNGVSDGWWGINGSNEDVDNGWTFITMEGDDPPADDLLNGQWASNPDSGMSYYLGGDRANDNDEDLVALTIIDHTDLDSNSWEAISDDSTPAIQFGAMEYLRHGEEGVLIAFGGYDASQNGTQFGDAWPFDLRDMSQIEVYDIASQTWFQVTATGQIPEPRSEFCTTVSAAPDDSSFNINMYGGLSRTNNVTFSESYILTIPAFRWIRVAESPENPDLRSDSRTGRFRHTCDLFNGRQMIVSGGVVLNRNEWNPSDNDDDDDDGDGDTEEDQHWQWDAAWVNQRCNESHPPFMVLDTTNFTWLTRLDLESPYQVPDIVTDVVGGTGAGDAAIRGPLGGFTDTVLGEIFSRTIPRAPEPDIITDEEEAASQMESQDTTTPTGAIAGGVIGGVGALCFAGIGFLAWRRKKRLARSRKSSIYESDPESNSRAPSMYDGTLPDYFPERPRRSIQRPQRPSEIDLDLSDIDLRTPSVATFSKQISASPTEMDLSQGARSETPSRKHSERNLSQSAYSRRPSARPSQISLFQAANGYSSRRPSVKPSELSLALAKEQVRRPSDLEYQAQSETYNATRTIEWDDQRRPTDPVSPILPTPPPIPNEGPPGRPPTRSSEELQKPSEEPEKPSQAHLKT